MSEIPNNIAALENPVDGPCELCRQVGIEKTAITQMCIDKIYKLCALCFINQLMYTNFEKTETGQELRKHILNHLYTEIIDRFVTINNMQDKLCEKCDKEK